MKKIMVLGAGGMLGHKLCQLLPEEGFDVIGTVRKPISHYQKYSSIFKQTRLIGNIDVLDEQKLDQLIQKEKPDVIVNAVGILKQLNIVKDPYISIGVNAFLPHRLARLCKQYGGRLIQMSSDCVFDGQRGQYRETELPNATEIYGQSKFLGETREEETNAITIRTSIIGREMTESPYSLVDWFISQKGGEIKGFKKAIFSGFTTHQHAKIITMLINEFPDLTGLYHVAAEPINKYDLLSKINDLYGLKTTINPELDFTCDRSLVMDRFTKDTGFVAPSWDNMLKEMHADKTPYANWY